MSFRIFDLKWSQNVWQSSTSLQCQFYGYTSKISFVSNSHRKKIIWNGEKPQTNCRKREIFSHEISRFHHNPFLSLMLYWMLKILSRKKTHHVVRLSYKFRCREVLEFRVYRHCGLGGPTIDDNCLSQLPLLLIERREGLTLSTKGRCLEPVLDNCVSSVFIPKFSNDRKQDWRRTQVQKCS